ncbi:MAG: hypothetical protein CL609_08215 [Anaerolineaceae bacterium]|nr:hypothetical protein [Anaerolineaceae bacterium]
MKLYIGIDWSSKKHDVCMMNEKGGVLELFEIENNQEGYWRLEERRKKYGVDIDNSSIGIETNYNLVIDFFIDQGYRNIYVIPPHLTHGNRSRFAVSKGHNDASDAKLIAEILRTDQGRLLPWQPDLPITRQIRAQINLIRFLTTEMVRFQNRFRDTLNMYYPQATKLFSDLDAKINLRFVMAYPNPESARSLSVEAFTKFCKENRYSRPKRIPEIYARLFADYPKPNPDTVLTYQSEALLFAKTLLILKEFREREEKTLKHLFVQHPDHHIFASLPGVGEFLAPALLAKFGDHRDRFPTPQVLQAVAGTAPVTSSSGKSKKIYFRKACDHEFRWIVQTWAAHSIEKSVWAAAYFAHAFPSSKSYNHACRCLANRWLNILWRLWMDRTPYDEVLHLKRRAKFTTNR